MCKTFSKLTVLFSEPFWIGIFERRCENSFEVCKIVFGAEPKDGEVYEFLLKNYSTLSFSPSIDATEASERKINPKRMQKEIANGLNSTGIGTKAQQALKAWHEQNKTERKTVTREMREKEKQRQFELKQEKRKEKHKGH